MVEEFKPEEYKKREDEEEEKEEWFLCLRNQQTCNIVGL
jgi:hypothetical protein